MKTYCIKILKTDKEGKKKKKFVQAVKGKLLFIYLEVGSLAFVDLYSFTKYFSFQGYKMLLLASDWILLGRAIHWLHTSGMPLMRAPNSIKNSVF